MTEFGIHPYYQTQSAKADLVLVHGLMGDSKGTWTGRDDKGQPTYWPDWIQERRPDVNIWRADYDSSLNAWLQPAMPLDQIGGALLMHAGDQGLGTRPLHWVGHSMGGLVIKYLLRQARAKADPNWRKIGEVPTAITFLGTPHHGAEVAKWEAYFTPLLTTFDLFQTGGMTTGIAGIAKNLLGNRGRKSHVQQLCAHAKALGDLNDDFAQWLGAADNRGNLRGIRNYYETLPVYRTVTVVPKHSAQLANALVEEAAVQASHFDICKFRSAKSTVFTGIGVLLDELSGRSAAGAEEPISEAMPANRSFDGATAITNSGVIPLDRNMLQHQAAHTVESLRRASAYWAALQGSTNLNDWLTAQCLISPSVFVESLPQVPPENLPRVMRELRNVFKEQKNLLAAKDLLIAKESEDAAAATVACFLFCACLFIEAEAGDGMVGLPVVGDRGASHLLAGLIALVMAGGRLELRPSGGALPEGSRTYRVQRTGLNAQFDFERQLYANLVKRPWSVLAGQKTGELSNDERSELLEELRNQREDGVRTNAMCFIVDGGEPLMSGLNVAREIGVPVFHASAAVVHALVGMDAATLVTMLRNLWDEVGAYQSPGTADSASP